MTDDEYDLIKDQVASSVIDVMAKGQKKLSDAIYGPMHVDELENKST